MFNEKTYKILKWCILIVIPAFATLVGTIGSTLNLENTDTIVTIIIAIDTFLGTSLGVDNKRFYKKQLEKEKEKEESK
ncbi:phage holin [Tetragenococcus phage phiYA5_2]|nr:phage holin [Tetragenococcus phage phiYA5_2]